MNYPGLFTPLAVALCVAAPALAQVQAAKAVPAYRNPALTVEERVADLLGRMTLEEKVGQLMMWDARSDDLSFINTRQPGSILHILGAKINRAMDLAAQNRLGIPLLVGEDGIHGHSFWKGATIFPTQLALAASWNPELLEQVGRVTAEEMAPTGIHWTFSPVLCLTRDLRWGRTGETFGEDPYLIGELGAALIRGYQGQGLDDPTAVLATAKHYAGYSETQGGRDASEADLSRRKLRSYFLPPFERAARAGAMTFMTGYQSMEGVPSTANRWLLTDVLKDEWGFRGVRRDRLGQRRPPGHGAEGLRDLRRRRDHGAARRQRHHDDHPAVLRGSHRGRAQRPPGRVGDRRALRRLLALKFRMGLFENPRRPDLDARRRRDRAARPPRRQPRRRAPEPGAAPEQRPAPARSGEGEVHRRGRPQRRRRPAAARRLVARLVAAPAGGRQAAAREDDHRARRHPRPGAGRLLDPLRTRLLDRRRRSLRHPRRGRRGAGGRRGRGRRGRSPEVHRRDAEHRHARAAGRTGRAARCAGEDRQADDRRAREQQAARAAALGQARRGDPRGLQPRHGGRARASPRRCSAS